MVTESFQDVLAPKIAHGVGLHLPTALLHMYWHSAKDRHKLKVALRSLARYKDETYYS